MDYREYSKDLLSRKKNLVSAFSYIKEELSHLETQKNSCKTLSLNGSTEHSEIYEDRIINILTEIDDCRFRLGVVERELLKIEKGLCGLSDYEKDIIETFFVEKLEYAADEIMERWFKERSTVYRDKVRALDRFTRCIYGVLQL